MTRKHCSNGKQNINLFNQPPTVMKNLIFCILILSVQIQVFSQECYDEYKNYELRLQKNKSINYFVDEMPEITQNISFAKGLLDAIQLTACPFKVQVAFVIEPDSSLSNIFVCAKMMCMTDTCNENSAKNKFENDLKNKLKSSKFKPGKHNGKLVPVLVSFPIHYECQ
jgi:hypothetical protein